MSDLVMTNLATRHEPTSGYGMRQAVRAELTKLRSIRSTGLTLCATVVGTLLITVLATNSFHHTGRGQLHGFDATNQSLTGLALGSLAIGVLGVLMITGEYSSGTIRSSLAATPRRPPFLGAKVAVIAVISLVVGEFLTFSCFFVGRAILSGRAPVATLAPSSSIWVVAPASSSAARNRAVIGVTSRTASSKARAANAPRGRSPPGARP